MGSQIKKLGKKKNYSCMQGCVEQEKVVRGHIHTGKLKFKELCTMYYPNSHF